MLDPLPIIPFSRPASASVRLPGSKSITNRALLLAALADGETALSGALFSEDTEIMIDSLRRLGFEIDTDQTSQTIRVRGHGGRIPKENATLFVGNAGTAARFLTAFCSTASGGVYELDGVPEMRKRPMKGLLDALESLGAEIESNQGHFPIRIRAHGLSGGRVNVDASASSQMLSALLMVAPLARQECQFAFANVRLPFVSMTLRMMVEFGQQATLAEQLNSTGTHSGQTELTVSPGTPYRAPSEGRYSVEADVTAASYFATLPLVTGGQLTIENLSYQTNGLQGDAAYFNILKKLGCEISATGAGTRFEFSSPSLPTLALNEDFSGFSDTFLTLAAISPLLPGETRIRGIAHTRKQETDRVAGMARELRKLGQNVVEEEDSLHITPSRNALNSAEGSREIETYRDHRFAMSFGLLGSFDLNGDGRPWLAIRDPECCGKTFPDFFHLLEAVRVQSSQS